MQMSHRAVTHHRAELAVAEGRGDRQVRLLLEAVLGLLLRLARVFNPANYRNWSQVRGHVHTSIEVAPLKLFEIHLKKLLT